MQQILAICREHGEGIGWWDGLDRGEQATWLWDFRKRQADAHKRGR